MLKKFQVCEDNTDDGKDVFKKPDELPSGQSIRGSKKRKVTQSTLNESGNDDRGDEPGETCPKECKLLKRCDPQNAGQEKINNEQKDRRIANFSGLKFLSLSSLPKLLDGTVTLSEDESDYFDYFPRTSSSSSKSKQSNLKKKILPNKRNKYDDEGDTSDCELNSKENPFKKYKVINTFVVRKNPGGQLGNIVFEEGSDYLETDNDVEDSECHCTFHDNLMNDPFNEYSCSSSDDEADTSCSFTG